MNDFVANLMSIADASRRQDGSDIPLGQQLREAASRISQQDAELERLRRHIELLREKDASQCACSIDTPDDVCLFHVRMKAEARKAAFIEAAEIASEMAKITNGPSRSIARRIEACIRGKAEETRT